MRNEMITERRLDGTQMSTRMTKLATGAAFTAPTSGASSVRTARQRPAAAASAMPATTASANPAAILVSDTPTAPQNSWVPASSASLVATSAGPTRMIREPTATAAACHTTSQNATASARSPQTESARLPSVPVSLNRKARRRSRNRRRGACRPQPRRSGRRAPRGSRRAAPSCRPRR